MTVGIQKYLSYEYDSASEDKLMNSGAIHFVEEAMRYR